MYRHKTTTCKHRFCYFKDTISDAAFFHQFLQVKDRPFDLLSFSTYQESLFSCTLNPFAFESLNLFVYIYCYFLFFQLNDVLYSWLQTGVDRWFIFRRLYFTLIYRSLIICLAAQVLKQSATIFRTTTSLYIKPFYL